MPVKIPDALPAARVLAEENIFLMTEKRAVTQDIHCYLCWNAHLSRPSQGFLPYL